MQFQSITLVLTFATSLMASPFSVQNVTGTISAIESELYAAELEFVELYRETVSNGSLIYYGGGNGNNTIQAEPTVSDIPEDDSLIRVDSSVETLFYKQ